jgi:hypothetical protein
MPTPSPEIIQLLMMFATTMTAPTFQNALVLLFGTILAPGRRTVTAALRVLGMTQDGTFGKYHRVLARARWSPMVCSRILLLLIVRLLVSADAPIVLLIDETLERRGGKKIVYKSWFRDAVRSTANRVTLAQGIRWCCVCVLVAVPWSTRPWALPFMVVPVLPEKTCHKLGKQHRGTVGWAAFVVAKVRRWHPDRALVLVGDGGYGAVELVGTCQRRQVTLVARLRVDASLYDFVGPRPRSKRGPKPKKGARQASLQDRLRDPARVWRRVTLPWYGGQDKTLELASGVCLWYTPGQAPVPIRWVLARCPERSCSPGAYVCSDLHVSAEQVLSWYVGRWNIEVTFEEVRAHLGFETQRHWSVMAIGRTTPCLFGIFTLVVLLAKTLHPVQLPLGQSSWYPKEEATFSDALAAVRQHLWRCSHDHYTESPSAEDLCLIPRPLLQRLYNVACYAN